MQIILEQKAAEKMAEYIKQATGEISGLGQSFLTGRDTVTVKDIWLWKQECSAATTEVLNHDAMIECAMEAVAQGAPMDQINVWWHSHANMGVFFSGQDQDTIDNWVNNRFLVSIVGNKKGDFAARVDIKEPIPCTIDNVPVSREWSGNAELAAQVTQEIALKVQTKKWAAMPYSGSLKNKRGQFQGGKNGQKWGGYNPTALMRPYEPSAKACLCADCQDFLADATLPFNLETHDYDYEMGLYTLEAQYAN